MLSFLRTVSFYKKQVGASYTLTSFQSIDTQPSLITREHQPEVAHTDVLPQSDVIPLENPHGHLSTRMV